MGQLVFIGLGIEEGYLTLKGLEEGKSCDKLFAEFYTSREFQRLENLFEKHIEILSREEVECGERVIKEAEEKKVGFLVPGDAMAATTHLQLRLLAESGGIETRIVCGVSIISAVPSLLGLQHYKFGRTTTLVRPKDNFFPKSPYYIIKENFPLHTLVLLDTEPPLGANEALRILKTMEESEHKGVFLDDTLVCVVARAGSDDRVVSAGRFGDMMDFDFGEPLHTIVIPGKLHFLEEESIKRVMI
jgi:diphthine synthase